MTKSDLIKWSLTSCFFLAALGLSISLQSCEAKDQQKTPDTIKVELTQPHPAHFSQAEIARIQKGKNIVGPSQKALGGQLKAALKSGGVAHALQYCNLQAYPIMDSLSKVYKVEIRRTSLKDRNPADQPRPHEREMLETFTAKFHAGENMDPIIRNLPDGQTGFYSAIFTQEMCLKCHGTTESDIAEADFALIHELYPQDKATGYEAGQLRGIWSLTFSPE